LPLNSTAKTLVYNGRNQLIRAGPTPTVSTRPVTLTGTVSDTYSPVKSLTLAGNPVTLNPDGSYAVDVTLNLGENVFTLQAEDEAGNLKTIQHQLFYGVDDITWSFDANGNLQRKEDTVNNIIETYTYDVRNRLSGYNKTINGTSTTTATYAYDPFGRRINKTVDGVETRYIYDINGTLLAETTADGTVTRKYIWAGLTPVAQIDIQGTTETVTYLHTDQLATARLGTDQTGTVVWHWDRDAFGTGAANDDPDGNGQATVVNLRFPGQYYDAETGMHYNYFRYYDPKTGRYITSDPIGLLGGINLYAYVNNNPVSYIDPWGLFKICRRPLSFTGNYMSSGGSGTNLGLYHQQGFYEDGSGDNAGYTTTGTFDDRKNKNRYQCDKQSYDDDKMREAQKDIENDWPADDYNFAANNCQDYMDDLLDRYNEITLPDRISPIGNVRVKR